MLLLSHPAKRKGKVLVWALPPKPWDLPWLDSSIPMPTSEAISVVRKRGILIGSSWVTGSCLYWWLPVPLHWEPRTFWERGIAGIEKEHAQHTCYWRKLYTLFIPKERGDSFKTRHSLWETFWLSHRVNEKSQTILLDPATLSVQGPAAYEEIKRVSVPSSCLGFVLSTWWPSPDNPGTLYWSQASTILRWRFGVPSGSTLGWRVFRVGYIRQDRSDCTAVINNPLNLSDIAKQVFISHSHKVYDEFRWLSGSCPLHSKSTDQGASILWHLHSTCPWQWGKKEWRIMLWLLILLPGITHFSFAYVAIPILK